MTEAATPCPMCGAIATSGRLVPEGWLPPLPDSAYPDDAEDLIESNPSSGLEGDPTARPRPGRGPGMLNVTGDRA